MEFIELICSLESELTFISTCSIRIHSRKWNIFEKLEQLISNPPVVAAAVVVVAAVVPNENPVVPVTVAGFGAVEFVPKLNILKMIETNFYMLKFEKFI